MQNRRESVAWQADVSGLHCPLPVIRCRATLTQMAVGDILKLRATDRDARREIEVLVAALGHQLVSLKECAGTVEFVIRKLHTVRSALPVRSVTNPLLGWSDWLRICTAGAIPVAAY